MKMNYNYRTTLFRSIFAQNVQISGRKINKMKNCINIKNTYLFLQKNSKYRSQIIGGKINI